MSKRNVFGFTVAALAGALLATGCKKDDKSGAAAPPAGDKPAAASATEAKSSGNAPGVTATEIKIGQTMPYSGPASAYGTIGKTHQAFFKMVNDQGGINGRKVNLISYDDAYSPPKTVEQIRKLVESDGVAFIFNSLGTPSNTAIQPYLNEKKIPQLFVATGADKWADPKNHPWTMGWQPSYRVEAKIYAAYLQKEKPNAKMCVLYQNDDFGKDYLTGLRQGFGDQYDKIVIKTASYEVSDPTVDSQIVTLQSAGCDTLLTAATPKFAAMSIRKVFDIGWKPLHFMTNVAVSITTVLTPAGVDKSVGLITGVYLKDPNDPLLAEDPGLKEYKEFVAKNMPGQDASDTQAVFGYGTALTLKKVLEQCGDDLSRENIMKQAASLKDLKLPVATEGIVVNTTAERFSPFTQMQLAKFDGKSFVRFGEVLGVN